MTDLGASDGGCQAPTLCDRLFLVPFLDVTVPGLPIYRMKQGRVLLHPHPIFLSQLTTLYILSALQYIMDIDTLDKA